MSAEDVGRLSERIREDEADDERNADAGARDVEDAREQKTRPHRATFFPVDQKRVARGAYSLRK